MNYKKLWLRLEAESGGDSGTSQRRLEFVTGRQAESLSNQPTEVQSGKAGRWGWHLWFTCSFLFYWGIKHNALKYVKCFIWNWTIWCICAYVYTNEMSIQIKTEYFQYLSCPFLIKAYWLWGWGVILQRTYGRASLTKPSKLTSPKWDELASCTSCYDALQRAKMVTNSLTLYPQGGRPTSSSRESRQALMHWQLLTVPCPTTFASETQPVTVLQEAHVPWRACLHALIQSLNSQNQPWTMNHWLKLRGFEMVKEQ